MKIVEIGNITKAAEQMGYSQSAISHVVLSLESEWNLKLLARDRQGVRLTREGELLLPNIKRVAMENRQLLQQVANLQTLEDGTICVSAFHSALVHLLPELMTGFSKLYPKVSFQLLPGYYPEVEQMVLIGKADCGFVQVPTTLPLDVIPLFQDRLLAVFPAGTRSDGERFPIMQVEGEPYITCNDLEYEALELFRKFEVLPGRGAYRKVVCNDHTATVSMVASGLGMCILPELMLKNQPFQLTKLELDPPAHRTIGIAYKKQILSPAAKKFIGHVQEALEAPIAPPKDANAP